MTQQVILETAGLQKRFGGVHAIDDVDFKLNAGELRCLIGPNGAGKSTFFKMITGQLAPTLGHVTFQGRDITSEERHAVSRLGIGIKNQVPDVFDGISVVENIWLAASMGHKTNEVSDVVDDVVDRLSLGDIRDQLVGELAHGKRQWVEFGMVVALDPTLILLDEPTAGMTAEETSRTAELIMELNKKATVVVVEHDMQFIRQIAQIVTVFHQGKILAEDTMENIQDNEVVRDVYLGKAHA